MADDISPMGALTRIHKRLLHDAAEVGLTLKYLVAKPNPSDESGPHGVQAVFTVVDDFDPKPKEEDEFDKMLAEQAAEENRRRQEEAREGLANLVQNLEEGDGIL